MQPPLLQATVLQQARRRASGHSAAVPSPSPNPTSIQWRKEERDRYDKNVQGAAWNRGKELLGTRMNFAVTGAARLD